MRNAVAVDAGDCPGEAWAVPEKGTLRWKTLLSAERREPDSLVCGSLTMASDQYFAFDHHPEAEVYSGLDGEAQVMIDGVPNRLAPGVALFIPGGAVHGVPQVSQPVRWFYTFARDSFDQIAYRFLPPSPTLPSPPVSSPEATA